jgi:hypothetical protein
MLNKTEAMAKRLRLLIYETESEILDTLETVEMCIDNRIHGTIFQNEHPILLRDLKSEVFLTEGQFRKLLTLVACRYQSVGWDISISDDSIVLS